MRACAPGITITLHASPQGVGLAAQACEQVPTEAHDIVLDAIFLPEHQWFASSEARQAVLGVGLDELVSARVE